MCWRMWEECDGARDSIVSSSSLSHSWSPREAKAWLFAWQLESPFLARMVFIDDSPITMTGVEFAASLQMYRLMKLKTAGNLPITCRGIYGIYLTFLKNNREITQHVIGWTWKHWHLDHRLYTVCPKTSPDTSWPIVILEVINKLAKITN